MWRQQPAKLERRRQSYANVSSIRAGSYYMLSFHNYFLKKRATDDPEPFERETGAQNSIYRNCGHRWEASSRDCDHAVARSHCQNYAFIYSAQNLPIFFLYFSRKVNCWVNMLRLVGTVPPFVESAFRPPFDVSLTPTRNEEMKRENASKVSLNCVREHVKKKCLTPPSYRGFRPRWIPLQNYEWNKSGQRAKDACVIEAQ